MIYYICPRFTHHISQAPGIPSNDYKCGWPGCSERLTYSPLFKYIYPKADMRDAVYSPVFGGSPPVVDIDDFDDDGMGGSSSSGYHFGGSGGSNTIQSNSNNNNNNNSSSSSSSFSPTTTTTTTTTTTSTTTSNNNNNNNAPSSDDLLELVQQSKPLITESTSQKELYGPLEASSYLFLRRDGQFGKYQLGTAMDSGSTVPEPGVIKGGYSCHKWHPTIIVGRNEKDATFYAGGITYPDYVVQKNDVTYFLELKTPRSSTFKSYLSNHFYTERVYGGRSVLDQMEARKALTPSGVENVFVFDIRNNTDVTQAITDLSNSISHGGHKKWWETAINGVIFYTDGGLTKRFTIAEILSKQPLSNKIEQKNIQSYFGKG